MEVSEFFWVTNGFGQLQIQHFWVRIVGGTLGGEGGDKPSFWLVGRMLASTPSQH